MQIAQILSTFLICIVLMIVIIIVTNCVTSLAGHAVVVTAALG